VIWVCGAIWVWCDLAGMLCDLDGAAIWGCGVIRVVRRSGVVA
jgi:hypothetical protein